MNKDLPIDPSGTFLNYGVRSYEDLMNWILTKLGHPLIHVELSQSQLNVCIQDALEKYTKYAWMGPDKYIIANTKFYEPNKGLNLEDKNILSIKDVSTQRDNMMGCGMDMFFSPYSFFGQGGLGASPFFNQANVSPTGAWTTYQCAVEWWKLARRMTGSNPDFQYDKRTKRLILMPEPNFNGDNYILLTCQVLPPLEDLYGNEYVKRLALCYAKILLGTIRKKFSSVQLIGGGTLDTSIGDEGQQELDKLLDEIIQNESKGQCCIIS